MCWTVRPTNFSLSAIARCENAVLGDTLLWEVAKDVRYYHSFREGDVEGEVISCNLDMSHVGVSSQRMRS